MTQTAATPHSVARVVILPNAGDTGILDYQIPEELRAQLEPGVRVSVPLGRQSAVGIVVATAGESAFPKLRDVTAVLDSEPVLRQPALALCEWLAGYYLTSLGEAITAALPGSVRISLDKVVSLGEPVDENTRLTDRQRELIRHLEELGEVRADTLRRQFGKSVLSTLSSLAKRDLLRVERRVRGGGSDFTRFRRYFRLRRRLDTEESSTWQKQRPAQYEIYHYLAQHPLGRAPTSELNGSFANAAAKLRSLVKAGLLTTESEEFYRPVLPGDRPTDRRVALNDEQGAAVAQLEEEVEGFRPFLLWGVTGSGKTEVYLHAIAAQLDAGRSALVLVPEISLTHQVVERVRARFGDGIAILHSGLSDGERWDEWRRIARGEVDIVVGARSAVFAPLPNLGLIVVDEEHDPSYKQDDGIRYHGRDVAVMRAKREECTVVLGSATPSMETFHNARGGRYTTLRLSERVDDRPMPAVEILDLRRSSTIARNVNLSPKLLSALEANLAANAQSLLFLNRRGFANFLQCHQCGEPLACPNCSVTLTLHRHIQALRCHHCDHTIPVPEACPACTGLSLGAWGSGTEQVECALQELLPNARIGRMDRDTTSRKGAHQAIIAAWANRELDILIGTQMVTKGHDVHGVTLVGVLLADLSLNFPDFRASERTFQLVAQVSGRAGRGERPGRVIVQTFQPDHPSLRAAEHHDFETFAEREFAQRRELMYPPFTRIVQFHVDGEDLASSEAAANDLARTVNELVQALRYKLLVLGPAPAPLEKLRRRHRWQVHLRGASGEQVRRVARLAKEHMAKIRKRDDAVRLIVDVDPQSML